MHRRARGSKWAGWVIAGLCGWAPPAAADDFETGSLIIPMDLDYQDEGMLRAYGLVYELLRSGVPVRWVIREGKLHGEADFSAEATDWATGAPVGEHGYRGGPFVVAAADAPEAQPIVDAWQQQHPETAVHEATALFSADVSRYLVAAPTIAMVADGNEDIARGYMQAAAIPDSTLSLDWADDSPDMLDIDELAGPSDVDHTDGALFDEDGHPVYCQLMSMHWDVGDAENNPEVVAEVRAFLRHPTHFFAECQAVNAFENTLVHGHFLTDMGFEIAPEPGEVDLWHSDSPFAQFDGPFETVGGSEPAYSLPPMGNYLAGDITMVTEAGTPEGVADVWMTGFLDGACPPEQHECGSIGKVSYLGGHDYATDVPVSGNSEANGVRLFLNSLLEAPCATVDGLPALALAVDAPAQTTEPTVTFSVTYGNTDVSTALGVMLVDPLPEGVTFISASDGGVFSDGVVSWDLGNLGPEESGDVTVEVSLDEYGTYLNEAELHYHVGLNEMQLRSNQSQTVYDENFGTSGGQDGTGGSGSATAGLDDTGGTTSGNGDSTGSGGTETETGGQANELPGGCGCRSTGPGLGGGWLWGGLLLLIARRRRLAGALGALALTGCSEGIEQEPIFSTGTEDSGSTQGAAEASDDDSGNKLDTLPPSDTPLVLEGCDKIDFLFVIDSSESMKAHQDNLVTSFPGFAEAIEGAVQADDWHVMVVDTDGQWNGADCANACSTLGSCPDEPAFSCSTPPPLLCDITIGSGIAAPYGEGASNDVCLLDDRYIGPGHPDLPEAFGCIAAVGVDGSALERTGEALVRSLSPELGGPDGCNAGFLRDDAILVVTVITDEPDERSDGEPPAWYDAVVAAKNDDETAVVVLGLLPDAAPRLAELVEMFERHSIASVGEPDYSPFLSSVVDVIAQTCAEFEPPA